jgi:hypothetical protein
MEYAYANITSEADIDPTLMAVNPNDELVPLSSFSSDPNAPVFTAAELSLMQSYGLDISGLPGSVTTPEPSFVAMLAFGLAVLWAKIARRDSRSPMGWRIFAIPVCLCIAVTLIPPASASSIGLTATGTAQAECGATQTYNSVSPAFSVATQGSVTSSGMCEPITSSSVTSTAIAVAGGVSGSVTVTGTGD